jgi:parallel beta-helix repeat protein
VYHRCARRRPRPHDSQLAEALESRLLLATFTVSTTNNTGPGSLREAITQANLTTAADVIRFAIPVSGGTVATIRPTTPLPAVTSPLDIDGTTQAGYGAFGPVVELSGELTGTGITVAGLTFTNANNSRVRGLAITRWSGYGVRVTSGTGVVVESNYIGLTRDGNAAANGVGVAIEGSSCRVGGTSAAQRNIISGNATGVLVGRDTGDPTPTSDDNVVTGNYVGTNPAGNAAVPNTRSGVRVAGSTNRTVIGGTAAGAGNLVSGNTQDGVAVNYPANAPTGRTPSPSVGIRIEGNTIGLGAGGAALPNATGVLCSYGDVLLGGTVAGARNVISGNATGVRVINGAPHVEGNYIGLNAAGTAAAANGVGVQIESASGARVGSDQPGARNVISGNSTAGVRVVRGSISPLPPDANHRIQGNSIGTNAAGTAAVPNGGVGIELVKATNVLIGGDSPAAANVVCGNTDGIRIDGSQGTNVRGNFIGVNAAGAAIPNTDNGVLLRGGAVHSTVSANVIVENRGNGIAVLDGAGNAFLSNSIHSNGGLGIDLGGDGVTPNDSGDADTGPNERQNFPVLTSVLNDGTNVFVRGTIDGRPAANTFRIQFFDSAAQDPSTFGEGATYLGEVTVTVGSTGRGEFTTALPAVQAGHFISATATGNPTSLLPASYVQTSEFSKAVSVPAADTTPPAVAGVDVNGTAWTDPFRRHLQDTGRGNEQRGYFVPILAPQLRPLPWTNLNEITIAFSEVADVQQDDLVIRGTRGNLVVSSFSVSGGYATWRLAQPIGADRVTLELRSGGAAGVKDLVGRPLDGEWANGADNFPSGDGAGGGDFVFTFNVLPGDVTGSGSVLADDFSEVKKRFFKDTADTTTGDTSYSPFHDVDGSGSILADDYSEVKKRFFDTLPPDEATFGATRVADEVLG